MVCLTDGDAFEESCSGQEVLQRGSGGAISEVCSFLGNCVTFSSVFELKMEDWMDPHPLGEGAKAEGRHRRTTQELIVWSSV